jgi:hypothetical protein
MKREHGSNIKPRLHEGDVPHAESNLTNGHVNGSILSQATTLINQPIDLNPR